ncbi:MAG: KR domain-containing protein [Clostridia bacterium]|nr:KR domain-containing protein [Clostridia bacterium]
MSGIPIQDALEGVAVIGMSGRFPGAKNIEEFWENLKQGKECITYFNKEDARACGIDEESINDPNYVFAGGILDDIELFDAGFFSLNPREAENLDPQQRLFLECSYEALEDAGYASNQYDYPIGVYAGSNMSYYFLYHLFNKLGVKDDLAIAVGNDKDYLATRTSYQFNLKGPSMNIQTACSTSMTAIAMAYEGLLNYHCDMALAGGSGVKLPQKSGYLFQTGFIGSPDGHTRPFDADANGTVFTSAAGVVLLKRLEDAVRDGDHIYAVIKGMAVNNDGSTKVGFTAPSREGEAEVISTALNLAGIDPEDIGFVEAHGTGTSLGDPIEISALSKVFERSTKRKGFCAVGSVKSNIGHAISGAGVAGMIKTVLALKHKQIPPSINFHMPNPKIDFENSAFYVNTRLQDWESSGKPRAAGVSSFGFGGTNVHAVLEEAPYRESSRASRPWQLITLSARTLEALDEMCLNLARHIRQNPMIDFADAVYTLHVGRKEFECRRAIICKNLDDALRLLEAKEGDCVFTGTAKEKDAGSDEVNKLIEDSNSGAEKTLTEIGKLWVEGAVVDWKAFHRNERRLRIPLPTYPFDRKRYWVDQYSMKDYLAAGRQPSAKSTVSTDWLYAPQWKRAKFISLDIENLNKKDCWLMFNDEMGLGDNAAKFLAEHGSDVIKVSKGDRFLRLNEKEYTVNPVSKQDYEALIKELSGQSKVVRTVLHLWNVTSDAPEASRLELSEECRKNGFYSLMFLAQALSQSSFDENIRIAAVSNNMHAISGEPQLHPEKATVLGASKVIPMEFNNLICQSIDVVLPGQSMILRDRLVKMILAELSAKMPEFTVALRGQHRWIQKVEKVEIENTDEGQWLRDGGIYLITGGLGGIGIALAEYLSGKGKVKLVLTRRSYFPERVKWQEWLDSHDTKDKTSILIHKLMQLEEAGSEVIAAGVDVSNLGQMRDLILRTNERFGRINGVFHAAGVSDNGLIQEKIVESAEKVFAPKVAGTVILDELLDDSELDFMVLFSSSSSIIGEAGFVDYAGANAFLDAYAYYKILKSNIFTVSINWDEWGEVGMAVNTNSRSRREKITVKDGFGLLESIIASKSLEQVIVAPGEFLKRLEDIDNFRLKPFSGENGVRQDAAKAYNRPELHTSYAPPGNKTEEIIAKIWQEHLGIYPVGINDDFFEIGGHSLMATAMISVLRKTFHKNISLQGFLENSTVAHLAQMFGVEDESEEFEEGRL